MADDVPEYLQSMTEEQARLRMLDAISDDYDKTEGEFVRDVGVDPLAVELAYMAFVAQETRRRGFASTVASTIPGEVTEELTMRAAEHGVPRKAPQSAKGIVTITGTPGKSVWSEYQVGTEAKANVSSVVFSLDNTAVIGTDGTVNVSVTALVPGVSGNVAAGTVTMLIDQARADWITGVTNAAPMTGGTDIEDDVSLLPRYLSKVQKPSTGGNKADYENWAMETPGVGGVSVVPLRDGDGTVSIAIIDTDKLPADAALVEATQDHIDSLAPIGAVATVEAGSQVLINISATLVIADGYDPATVKAAATTGGINYIKSKAFDKKDNDIRYAWIGDVILNTEGVLDHNDLLINGGTSNIVIDTQEVAVPGTVVFT